VSLGDVLHQGFAQRLIQRAVTTDRLPHAYLFHGPDGVGKETLALALAQLLLCGAPTEIEVDVARRASVGVERLRVGCGRCEDCRLVAARTHPDLHLIYRQLAHDHPDAQVRKRMAKELSVDVVRHFITAKVGRTPARGRAKIFVVREANLMKASAQNALLKTLEEPPGATVIILLTISADRLLPTTRSRCQSIRFDGLPTAFVETQFAKLQPEVAPDEAKWYARCSDGSIGRAVEFVADGLFAINHRLIENLVNIGGNTKSGALTAVVKAWTDHAKALGDVYRKRDPNMTATEASRLGLKQLFGLASWWYADVLRFCSGERATVVNEHLTQALEVMAKALDAKQAIDAINRINQAGGHLDSNVYTQLCVETLLHDLARLGRGEGLLVG
jgi:DNA polymerase-3 subunit delta'